MDVSSRGLFYPQAERPVVARLATRNGDFRGQAEAFSSADRRFGSRAGGEGSEGLYPQICAD
jgi:hypothetical protein